MEITDAVSRAPFAKLRVQNTRQTNTNWTHQKTYLSQKKARHFAGLLSIAQIQELEHVEIEKAGQLFRSMLKAKGLGCFLDFGFLGIDFLGLAAARAFLQLRFDHFHDSVSVSFCTTTISRVMRSSAAS